MIGPAPMIMIVEMSVRFGIESLSPSRRAFGIGGARDHRARRSASVRAMAGLFRVLLTGRERRQPLSRGLKGFLIKGSL